MLPVLQEERVKCLFFVTGSSAGEERVMLWYEELFFAILRARGGPFEVSFEGIDLRGELGSRVQRRTLWWSAVKKLSCINAQKRNMFLRNVCAHLGSRTVRDLDQKGSTASRRYGLLTCGELRQLASAGMAIGAHTMSHPMLSQGPAELACAEISESRTTLESALQTQVWGFAYPFGNEQSVTPEVLAMPQKAGFEMAFVNFGGGLGVDLPAYALPRIHLTVEMSLPEFEAHVSGFYTRLQRRAGRTPRTVESMRAA
jgi:peptidoglycan/xylan/chitin deacetylase (PgdA/CDA1 family)